MKKSSKIFIIAMTLIGGLLHAQETKVVKTKDLKFHIYTAKPQNFGVTSVLIEGKKDLVLVDAQFSKDEAQNVVDIIKKTKKQLKTVFISHSDPDFYFGLDVINENFPQAKIISTPETAFLIEATKDSKLEVWGPQLKENAPSKIIIPEAFTENSFSIEGKDIEIKQTEEDPAHSYLWIPSTKTILGGVSLFDGIHVWLADSPIKADRLKWINKLDEMNSLSPKMVIPAHFDLLKDPNLSPNAINYTKKYIIDFDDSLDTEKNYDSVVARMKKLYPNAGEVGHLEISAGVHTGQLKWEVAGLFPAVASTIEVDYNEFAYIYNFKDNKHIEIAGKGGIAEGVTDTAIYTAKEIGKKLFMIYWTESKYKTNVVMIYDYSNDTVYTNISSKDNTFINLKGRITNHKFNKK